MATIEESIEVKVPVRTAYDQWTQFEEFPRFMAGVESVQQLDDTHLHWVADIGGVRREWDAEITEQHPDERVAWRATDGAENAGVVTFHHLDDATTKVMLQLEFDPDGLVEQVGDKLGIVKSQTKADLDRFKEFIEERGTETGGMARRRGPPRHLTPVSDQAASSTTATASISTRWSGSKRLCTPTSVRAASGKGWCSRAAMAPVRKASSIEGSHPTM